MNQSYPRLISDIGGTNARFSLETSAYKYEHSTTLACKDYENMAEAITHYLKEINVSNVEHAAIALPAPIVDDTIIMVNSPWQHLSQAETKAHLGIKSLIFLNDFHALSLSIPHIDKSQLVQVGGLEPDTNKPIGILGPGTGLGMALLTRHPNGEYLSVAAEGGHSSVPLVNEEEFELWHFVHKRFHHVSVERLISGPGLQLMYEAISNIKGIQIMQLPTPAEITTRGINNQCLISKLCIDHFCRILGTVAANLAIMSNSFGGIYLGGGIIPQMLDYFINSDFRCRFEDKGRLRPYLTRIPVYVILEKYPAFLGVSHALDSYLNKGYIP